MEYHCRVDNEEAETFANYDDEAMGINRWYTQQQGIPKNEKYLDNGNLKFHSIQKNMVMCNK